MEHAAQLQEKDGQIGKLAAAVSFLKESCAEQLREQAEAYQETQMGSDSRVQELEAELSLPRATGCT